MPIRVIPMPDRAEEALQATLIALLDTEDRDTLRSRLSAEEEDQYQQVALPHQVFLMGLDEVVRGEKPQRPASVRLMVLDGNRARAAVEIDPETSEVRHVTIESSHLDQTIKQLDAAMNRMADRLERNEYEFRLLRIPALYITAIWLRGEEDLVIPLEPTFGRVSAGEIYRLSDLLELVQGEARMVLEEDDGEKVS